MSIFVAPRPVKAVIEKAGPVGPGSGVLLTEFPLSVNGKQSPQKRMQVAWTYGKEVPWINLAEMAIGERFSGVEWHLEDENDEEVTDASPNTDARAALALLEKPGASITGRAPLYRSSLWALTSRAMGLCGSAMIFQDQPEALAGTPAAMIPIAPWRFTPQEDPNDNLIGWWIDRTSTSPGIAVSLEQVLHYKLQDDFIGHFGVGLVETAMLKLGNSQGLDQHLALVLSAGGRISGILSPKSGLIEPDTMLQMERDWRTVVEQSDAAKRLQLVRAPVDFQKTTLTPQELAIRDLLNGARDDLLTIWGVPLSIVGGTVPTGLNSGESRKYDEAAIWQGPVHSRLTVFREVTQYQLLDRYAQRGAVVELEIEEPEFDDDGPRYDLLSKSADMAMTNEERRALIGLPPTGDPIIDKAILLPSTLIPYAMAPSDEGVSQTPTPGYEGSVAQSGTQAAAQSPAAAAAGPQADPAATEKKARLPQADNLHTSLVRIRQNTAQAVTPRLRSSVKDVLDLQRRGIVERIRKNAEHIAKNRLDTSIWFPKSFDRDMHNALRPALTQMASAVQAHISDILPPKANKASPVDVVLSRGAARVTGINETTRKKVQEAIIRGLEEGLSVLEVADLIEQGGMVGDLDMSSIFGDYRAEMVARTELMDAYNGSAIASYAEGGLTQVQAIDGDQDEECADRDGRIYDLAEADGIQDHPNGTLDWLPVFGEQKARIPNVTISDAMDRFTSAHVESMEAMRAIHTDALQAVTGGMSNLGERVDALAAIPHPDINVEAPVVNVPAPIVNVPAPVVNVEAPIVNVPEPVVVVQNPPRERTVTKNRDGSYSVKER